MYRFLTEHPSVLIPDKCNKISCDNITKPFYSKNTISKDSIQARVIRVPGDGACLFHAICHFLPKITATELRRQVAGVMIQCPQMMIGDQPLSAWIEQDANVSIRKYAKHIENSDAFLHSKSVHYDVLEPIHNEAQRRLK